MKRMDLLKHFNTGSSGGLFLAVLFSTLFLIGCEKSNFLETVPLSVITGDAVFSDVALTRANLLTVYGKIPRVFGRSGGIPFDMNTRDAAHSFPWTIVNDLRNNDYSASTGGDTPQTIWFDTYISIRQANTFIEGVESSKFDDAIKKTYIAEAKFLRAVLYLDLYRFFGGVPIIKKAQDISSGDSLFVKRNSADETISFIVKEISDIADELPVSWTGNDKGRAEKGAALGMKARALIYAASLNNDLALFQQAALAAKAVIDLNRYSLYPDYGKMFFAKSDNNEFIFYYNYSKQSPQGWPLVGGWAMINAGGGGGWQGAMPSQNLVDEFEMTDGKRYSESPLYDPMNPYKNRDPRFEASIYHQGSTFKGIPFQFFVGGKDYNVNGFTTSGYFIKKGIDESIPDYYFNGMNSIDQFDPLLRYADILLIYAEAENEIGNTEEARTYVNKIRSRPGVDMPDLPIGLSKEQMREKIRQERHIELCFEESRFHDVRRWGIAPSVSAGPVYGAKITKNGDGTLTYGSQVLFNPTFDVKYKLLPIPQEEMNKNKNLVQNPGY